MIILEFAIAMPQYEAHDIIDSGSWLKMNLYVTIVSGDKDFNLLMDEHTVVEISKKGVLSLSSYQLILWKDDSHRLSL